MLTNALGLVHDHFDDIIIEVPTIAARHRSSQPGRTPGRWHVSRSAPTTIPDGYRPHAGPTPTRCSGRSSLEPVADRRHNPGLDETHVESIIGDVLRDTGHHAATRPDLDRGDGRRRRGGALMALRHPARTASPVRLYGRRVLLRPLAANDFRAWSEVRRRNAEWLTVWEPSRPGHQPDPVTDRSAFAARVRTARSRPRRRDGIPVRAVRRQSGRR